MISSRIDVPPEAVASHYDDLDHFYRDVWGEHVHHGLWLRGNETRDEAVLQLVDRVAERVRVVDCMRICDIGCGYGATARALAQRGAEVTGITISPAQFGIATQQADRNPQFVCGDWTENNFASGSFDAAIAIESSEHMADKAAFFAQAHRVLRAGGRLVICAWLAAEHPSARAQRWLLEPICREGRMPQLGSESDYRELGVAAGFAPEQFEDVTRRVERTWPAIVRRLLVKFATSPRYLKFLFSPHENNRVFALTILRIWLAYRTNSMRYGVFTFVKS